MQLECYAVTDFRTMIVPAALVDLARTIAAGLSSAGADMFTTPLGTGVVVSYYVSTGHIGSAFAAAIADPALLHDACVAASIDVTLAQCESIVSQSDVSEEPPFEAFSRLGVQLMYAE